MYIWTVEHQILNLDNYKRIDVVQRSQDKYWLSAHDTPKDTSKDVYGILIASFGNREDAMYARCLLFKGLMQRAAAWDAEAIPNLSNIWAAEKEHLSSETNICLELLDNLEMSVTGLDEVTLTYPRRLIEKYASIIEEDRRRIGAHLQEVLSMDIKWKVLYEQ